jgi:hypothetical protein
MKIVLSILGALLLLPVVLLVGIALGPAALVMLFVVGWALPVVLVARAFMRDEY